MDILGPEKSNFYRDSATQRLEITLVGRSTCQSAGLLLYTSDRRKAGYDTFPSESASKQTENNKFQNLTVSIRSKRAL
jgi:hypothetical protein